LKIKMNKTKFVLFPKRKTPEPKLHTEMHLLYSGNFCCQSVRNYIGILVGKPEGKRPLERPRRRWVDNIKMDLVEIG
jgi:hypothetical protein